MIEPIRSWLKRTALAEMLALPLAAVAQTSNTPFSKEQLDQMLAQIALYPDSLNPSRSSSICAQIHLKAGIRKQIAPAPSSGSSGSMSRSKS